MPRPGPRRPVVALRLADDVRAMVEARAEGAGINLSEQIRQDIDRANSPRSSVEWEQDLWERVRRIPEEDRVEFMRNEYREIGRILSQLGDAITKRGELV
jgi:hypothetical protein